MIAKVASRWLRHRNSRSGSPDRAHRWSSKLALVGVFTSAGLGAAIATAALLTGASATGCSEDPCSQANDLLSQCAAPDVSVPSLSQASMSLSCSGTLLCQANCINAASCLEIESLQCFNEVSCAPLTKGSVATPLALCIEACSGEISDAGTD